MHHWNVTGTIWRAGETLPYSDRIFAGTETRARRFAHTNRQHHCDRIGATPNGPLTIERNPT